MNLKGVYKSRITDDLKSISLLRQLFPVKDSAEDLDLILEMSLRGLSAEDVIKKFDNDLIPSIEHGVELSKGFSDFLSEYSDSPESLDSTIYDYCVNTGIDFDTAVDALNQWLTPQLKYELTESF